MTCKPGEEKPLHGEEIAEQRLISWKVKNGWIYSVGQSGQTTGELWISTITLELSGKKKTPKKQK